MKENKACYKEKKKERLYFDNYEVNSDRFKGRVYK